MSLDGMNRRQRRAFEKTTGMRTRVVAQHKCEIVRLVRFTELDHSVPPDTCDDTSEECMSCVDGVTPTVDFLGYKCPVCDLKWIQMQYVLRGERYTSWKSAKELLDGQ